MQRTITSETGSVAFTDSLPVEVLMKSAPAIMATQLARAMLRSVIRSPVPRIAFMCVRPASFLECGDFVVEGLPLAIEDVSAGDDDVDLRCAGFDASGESLHAFGERRKPCGKSGGDCGHRNAGAFERLDGRFDECVINADRADGEVQLFDAEAFDEMALQRVARLGAEPADAIDGVVTAERGQVHAGDGTEQPRGLRILLHGASGDVGLRRGVRLRWC